MRLAHRRAAKKSGKEGADPGGVQLLAKSVWASEGSFRQRECCRSRGNASAYGSFYGTAKSKPPRRTDRSLVSKKDSNIAINQYSLHTSERGRREKNPKILKP